MNNSLPSLKNLALYVFGIAAVYWMYYVYGNFYGNYEPYWRVYIAALFASALTFSYQRARFLLDLARVKIFVLRAIISVFLLSAVIIVALYTLDSAYFVLSLAAWYVLGRFVVGLTVPELREPEKSLFSLAGGMTVFSYLLLGIGAAGHLTKPYMLGFNLAILALLGYRELKGLNPKGLYSEFEAGITGNNLVFLSAVLFSLIFSIVLVGNLAPPTAYDDIAYHLTVPNQWVINGRVGAQQWVNLPFSIEMLTAQGITLGSRYVFSGLMNSVFAVLLFGAFYCFGNKFFAKAAGATGYLFLFSVVYYIFHLYTYSADMKFLLFCLLSLHALFSWTEVKNIRWLYTSAVFAGFSMSYRYQGIIVAAFIFMYAAYILLFKHKDAALPAIKRLLLVALLACIAAFPWYLKNWIDTGNPIWPAATSLFNGCFGDTEMTYYFKVIGNPDTPYFFGVYGFGTSLWHLIKLPWNITFAAGNYEGYAGTPIYYAFLPFILFALKQARTRLLLFLILSYSMIWFFAFQQMKFLIPALALLGIAESNATINSFLFKKPVFRAAIFAFMFFPAIYSFRSHLADFGDKLPVILKQETPDSYLVRNCSIHDFIEKANSILPADAYVLSYAENRLFYLRRKALFAGGNVQVQLDYRTMSDFGDLIEDSRRLGLTHIMGPAGRSSGIFYPQLSATNSIALDLLMLKIDEKYLNKLFESKSGLALYEIRYPAVEKRSGKPMNPEKIGDACFDSGMLDVALMQYEKAAKAGNESARKKYMRIDTMTPLDKGDYYYSLVLKFKNTRYIKYALDEYAAAYHSAKSASECQTAAGKYDDVHSKAMQLAPHIWNNAPYRALKGRM